MFKKPLSEITYQDVLDLTDVDELETPTTDAKKLWAYEKILRDITEFANTYGGIVLVGVDEDKKATTRRWKPDGVPYNRKDIETLENKVMTLTYPPVRYEIGKVDIPDGDKCVWIIRVPQSEAAPHEVRINGEQYLPGRYGTRGRNLSLSEIKDLLARQRDVDSADTNLLGEPSEGNNCLFEIAARPLRHRVTPILRPDYESAFCAQAYLRFVGRTTDWQDSVSARAVEIGFRLAAEQDSELIFYRLDNTGQVTFSHRATKHLSTEIDVLYVISRVAEFLSIYLAFLKETGQNWSRSTIQVRLYPPTKTERRGVRDEHKNMINESPSRAPRPERWFFVDLMLPLDFDEPAWQTVRDIVAGVLREHGHLPNHDLLNATVKHNCRSLGLQCE